MAEKDVNPLFMSDVDMTFGADDYAGHLSSVTLTPQSSTVTWKGLKKGSSFSRATTPTWTANLEGAQDWGPDGFSRYLYEHEGETVDVTLTPRAGGPVFSVSLIITPGAIGGAVDAYATQSVTLGIDGRPELSDVASVARFDEATFDDSKFSE